MLIKELNNLILSQAAKLKFRVSDNAPSIETDLFNTSKTLVVWSGASDNTIFNDPKVNHAFRALHDALHLVTGMGFTINEEIELGRIQASKYDNKFISDLIYIEVAGQAKHFRDTGTFVSDQVAFTLNSLKKLGY